MSTEAVARSAQEPSHHRADEAQRWTWADFFEGAALIFDFTGTITWRQVSTVQYPTDADALAADWDAVGDDLRWAMSRHPSHRPTQ